ncbi:MAG TPA: polysaccharide biosynthesis protein [Firmicutes bacterium]|nr:polysaccharide biosynthesis protein [Bacillota bacterium]
MKQQNVLTGAIILTVNSFIIRIIGFVFRIYLSGTVGAEGMGIYQLVLSLYMLVANLGTAGISIAVSRLVAEQLAVGHSSDARHTIRSAVVLSLLISCTAGIILWIFAEPLALYVLKDTRTLLSLRILAPSIPFMAVASCYKGYFFAVRDTLRPAASQLVEQLVKMACIIGCMGYCLPKGLAVTCAGIVFGMTVSEVVSLLFVFILYRTGKRPVRDGVVYDRHISRKILAISVPLALSAVLTSSLRLMENVLIVDGFRKFGVDESVATGAYGMLKGMAMPLLFFPSSILSALAVTLIPDVSAARARGDDAAVSRTVSTVLQVTTLLSIPVVGIFLVFPMELGTVIYQDAQVGQMLRALSFICPFMYIEMVIGGILNALDEQVSTMAYNVTDSVLRIALIWILVPRAGMEGFLFIIILSNLFTAVLKLRRLLKITRVSFKFRNWMLYPVMAAAAGSLTARLCCQKMTGFIPLPLNLILGCCLIIGVYFIFLLVLGCVGKNEIDWVLGRLKRRRPRQHAPTEAIDLE